MPKTILKFLQKLLNIIEKEILNIKLIFDIYIIPNILAIILKNIN